MMSDARMNHLTEEELHALAESPPVGAATGIPGRGESPAASAAATRHLALCGDCRADVDRIRALLAHAAALPRELDPPADLWPDIRRKMHAPRAAPFGFGRGLPRRAYVWLAAAAILLIAASSALTTLILRGGDKPVAAGHDERGGSDSLGAAAQFRTVSDEYDRMDRDLAALLASQREKLQPETIEKVERNLAIIDGAIAEIRQALAEDPNNRALQQLLKASYGQKAALLRQVSQS